MAVIDLAPYATEELPDFGPVAPLLRADIREAAATLGLPEVRYLVDLYYQLQDYRKASADQRRSLIRTGEEHRVIAWAAAATGSIEIAIRKVLHAYTKVEPSGMGGWARAHVGIGPVISAGLLAHIDITKAPSPAHIWSFAGLNPSAVWEKGKRRPWNARLKVLCYILGESFVKFHKHPDCFYGHIYRERKDRETELNSAGVFKNQAAEILASRHFRTTTEAYKHYIVGELPDAQIHARARRYAVKLFLSHYWEVAYRRHYNAEPPAPYAIAHLGHTDMIRPVVRWDYDRE